MNFEYMTTSELLECLRKEYHCTTEDEFLKVLVSELPRRMIYRVISKLYRKRTK